MPDHEDDCAVPDVAEHHAEHAGKGDGEQYCRVELAERGTLLLHQYRKRFNSPHGSGGTGTNDVRRRVVRVI